MIRRMNLKKSLNEREFPNSKERSCRVTLRVLKLQIQCLAVIQRAHLLPVAVGKVITAIEI